MPELKHPATAEMMTVTEVCRALNLGHVTLYAMFDKAVLPSHRIGRQYRDAHAHDLGDGPAVTNHLQDLRRDERHRFRMIQLQAPRPALAREFAGRKNQQLVDFAWREMHGSRSYASLPRRSKYCVCRRKCRMPPNLTLFCQAAAAAASPPSRPAVWRLCTDGSVKPR